MAVYKRSFHPYAGELTAEWSRFLVLSRYALRDIFRSKLFVVFLTLCFVYPLLSTLAIYLRHNADLLASLTAIGADLGEWVPIDERFFGIFLRVQGTLAFFLVLFSGPRLVSRDLANNGLALYLCRPFTKTHYVAGKLSVLAILMSAITWVPGLLLFLLQASLVGRAWAFEHWRSAAALVVGSWVWIGVLGFLALAVSAWVKWRPVAGFLLLLLFFGGGLFAQIFKELFKSEWGNVFDLHHNVRNVWAQLFGTDAPFFWNPATDLPGWAAWAAMGVLVTFSLMMLNRRIRAYEVIR